MYNDTPALPQCMQRLIGSVERGWIPRDCASNWRSIDCAPFGRNLQLSVIEKGEVHALVFACRRAEGGWMHALTGHRVSVDPTHWRHWEELSQ